MTVDEMERLLDTLGVEHVGARGDEVQGFCPAHEERTGKVDRNPSWYINSDTGAHICFSCEFKGNIISLVAKLKGFDDFDKAKAWINGDVANDFLEVFDRTINKKKKHVFEDLVYVSEASLSAFKEPPAYALTGRGLTPEAAEKYGVLWNKRTQAWITQIRNIQDNALLGWQEKGYYGRYFNNYPYGIKKSNSLFGLDQYNGGTMIVVESPLDAVRLESVGISGGVSTFGAIISDKQLDAIRMSDRIIFAMDADEAGKASSKRLLELTQKLNFEAWFFDYSHTDMKDVGAMSRAEIITGIRNATHSVTYGIELNH
jgi:DNA primase